MTSAIDSSKPTAGVAFTSDVRANFALAASETSALQAVQATIPENLFHNLSLSCTATSNALTIAIKTAAGGDPSSSSPTRIAFRNASQATGDYTVVSLTGANSLVLSSGSTLGVSTIAVFGTAFGFRIWVVAFNDGGTVRLGAINCLDTPSTGIHNIFALAGTGIASSTAEGGAGAADSAHVFYTGTAVSSKAYTILGYFVYESPLTTQGVWDVGPTKIQLFGPTTPLPGHIVQLMHKFITSVASGTTVLPSDDTVPQDTEGEAALTITLNPTSAANVGLINTHVNASGSTASTITAALFTNSSASALAATANIVESAGRMFQLGIRYMRILGRTTPVILTVRVGLSVAGTVTLNGVAAARLYGGVYDSYIEVQEIMA